MSLKEIIAKIFLLLFACLTIVVLILIIDSRDEDLTPEAKAFAEYKPIDIDRNFFIAWSGLHAPSGTQDIHLYGKKLHKGEINRREVAELRFNDDAYAYAYDQNKTKQNKTKQNKTKQTARGKTNITNIGRHTSKILYASARKRSTPC